MVQQPYTYAHATVVSGEQGAGKSTFVVARTIDAKRRNEKIRAKEMRLYGKYKTPELRIFSNFTLYGIEYAHVTLAQIIEWLDLEVIRNAYVLIDEAYIAAYNRDGMSNFVKTLNKYSMTLRKRRIDLYMLYPIERMADYTYREIVTERVFCLSYDKKTGMATVQIKKRKQKWQTITYNARQYQKHFNTEETFKIPPKQVRKAIQSVQ